MEDIILFYYILIVVLASRLREQAINGHVEEFTIRSPAARCVAFYGERRKLETAANEKTIPETGYYPDTSRGRKTRKEELVFGGGDG